MRPRGLARSVHRSPRGPTKTVAADKVSGRPGEKEALQPCARVFTRPLRARNIPVQVSRSHQDGSQLTRSLGGQARRDFAAMLARVQTATSSENIPAVERVSPRRVATDMGGQARKRCHRGTSAVAQSRQGRQMRSSRHKSIVAAADSTSSKSPGRRKAERLESTVAQGGTTAGNATASVRSTPGGIKCCAPPHSATKGQRYGTSTPTQLQHGSSKLSQDALDGGR